MCELFVKADPKLWQSRLRSVRMDGFSTSLRLENIYWGLLEEIARRDGLTRGQMLARLYRELLETHGAVENFASFLRVCCARYLMLRLAGDIPSDQTTALASLDAATILARESRRAQAQSSGAASSSRKACSRARDGMVTAP